MRTDKRSQNNQAGARRLSRFKRALRRLFVVFVLFAATLVWLLHLATPPAHSAKFVTLKVRSGESVRDVATQLQKFDLVRNAFVFRLYVIYTGTASQFRAGTYRFQPGTSMSEIVYQIVDGNVAGDTVVVTIPEGFTVSQIASKLDASHVCAGSAFLNEVQHGSFTEPFLSLLPAAQTVKWRLEGYLFPDTYDFTVDEAPHRVVNEMLDNFAFHVDATTMDAVHRSGLTLPQAITEASLVEKEAKRSFERPIVASVIQNRLHHKPPMLLQIDATIEYILGHHNVLTDSDLKVNDPYNTYLNPGLPPGPIANPGMASIDAVLNPAHTPYLYYVVKNDGSGEHYFSKTYNEQLRHEALSAANLRTHSH